MILKDTIPFGIALPHRSPDPIDIAAVRHVAQRADVLGFRDLWVTENTLDHVFCFDSVVLLTYAAALTTMIRLGVSVMVLPIHQPIHIAHQIATLDYLSNGRAVLGVGLGRNHHYTQFQVPREQRIRRFRESVDLSTRRRHDGTQAGAEATPADLVRRRAPGRDSPGCNYRRRMDGPRRLKHGGLCPQRLASESRTGEGPA